MEEESPKPIWCSKSKPKAQTIPSEVDEESRAEIWLWQAQDHHGNKLRCLRNHDGPCDFGSATRYIVDRWGSSLSVSVGADFYLRKRGIRHRHELNRRVVKAQSDWELFIEKLNEKQEKGFPKFVLEGGLPPDIMIIRMSDEE